MGCFSHLLAPCPQPPMSSPSHEVHRPGRSPPRSRVHPHEGERCSSHEAPEAGDPLLPSSHPPQPVAAGSTGFNPQLSRPVLPPSWRRLQPQPAYLLPSVQHSNPFLFPSLCSKHTSPCPRPHPFHGLSGLLDLSHGIHLLLLVKLLFIPQSPGQPLHLLSHTLHAPAPRGCVRLPDLRSQSPRAELLIGLWSSFF